MLVKSREIVRDARLRVDSVQKFTTCKLSLWHKLCLTRVTDNIKKTRQTTDCTSLGHLTLLWFCVKAKNCITSRIVAVRADGLQGLCQRRSNKCAVLCPSSAHIKQVLLFLTSVSRRPHSSARHVLNLKAHVTFQHQVKQKWCEHNNKTGKSKHKRASQWLPEISKRWSGGTSHSDPITATTQASTVNLRLFSAALVGDLKHSFETASFASAWLIVASWNVSQRKIRSKSVYGFWLGLRGLRLKGSSLSQLIPIEVANLNWNRNKTMIAMFVFVLVACCMSTAVTFTRKPGLTLPSRFVSTCRHKFVFAWQNTLGKFRLWNTKPSYRSHQYLGALSAFSLVVSAFAGLIAMIL